MYSGLTVNDSRYYGLSLFWTQNDVPKVSTLTRVNCIQTFYHSLESLEMYSLDAPFPRYLNSFVITYLCKHKDGSWSQQL